LGGVEGGSKLERQAAQARGVVGKDAKEELSGRGELLDLVELVSIVKGHLCDSLLGCVANVRLGLAGLCVDDARRLNADVEDRLDLSLGSAVETRAQTSQQT
jgi:hypothetical protein